MQKMTVLGNVSVVVIGDTQIKKYVKQKCKAEEGRIESIFCSTCTVLHCPVNPKNPEWFDEKIKKKQKEKISDELPVHSSHIPQVSRQMYQVSGTNNQHQKYK